MVTLTCHCSFLRVYRTVRQCFLSSVEIIVCRNPTRILLPESTCKKTLWIFGLDVRYSIEGAQCVRLTQWTHLLLRTQTRHSFRTRNGASPFPLYLHCCLSVCTIPCTNRCRLLCLMDGPSFELLLLVLHKKQQNLCLDIFILKRRQWRVAISPVSPLLLVHLNCCLYQSMPLLVLDRWSKF